jgi:PDZ domain-containing secreted protein
VVAAERAGAAVFFVPIDNAEAARSVARKMVIVPVRTFRDALDYLGVTP